MMRALVILLLGLVAVSAYQHDSQRIVGGSTTTINQYPEMGALLWSAGTTGHRQSCGGSILNNRAILSAAHCTVPSPALARWQTRLGSTNANSGGRVFATSRIINHPQYNTRTFDNDICILHVTGNIVFSNVIRAARIGAFNVGDNQVVWAAGWGRTSANGPVSEVLRHVQVWTVNQNTCNQRYGGRITVNMLCAGWLDVGGRDTCTQDSGGPLFHNGVVIGITSWGQSCASPRYPGVYARVSRYVNWINSNR